LNEYGKLPHEIYQLTNIALIKALAVKQSIKTITLTKNRMAITYYNDIDISVLMKKLTVFKHFRFENTTLPTIVINPDDFSVQSAVNYLIEFLSN
jgi:transcription-repair coupling factor (superfamily II helicase)